MTLSLDQQKHLEALLIAGEELEAVRYLQDTLGLSAEEALQLTEKLDKTVEQSPAAAMFKTMKHGSKHMMKDSKIGKWIGGVFMFFGLVMLSVCIYIFYSNYKFAQNAVSVNGKVIGFDTHYSSDDDGGSTLMYSSIFKYEYQGQEYEHTSDVSSSSPDYDEGEEVEILIDPEKPSKALVNEFWDRWFIIVLMGIMGSMFTGGGLMAFKLS
ncbi:DUF3592 domain-containing protein [Fulvivirga lutimaris]|uniref:DUF3592 domain-containing protein n=1 Tax=Fulvivirga lutimaris TaxID=1819566 RepID=UPI0012BD5FFD|nr:DUF3592 domain-containing protein [Fulvivirga lutimaris]MTI39537.1 DUF3592 domain-containing protein [Fulvivirga lutimaris]